MSTNAFMLAVFMGVFFAFADRVAQHVADRSSRAAGSAIWVVLVLVPAVVLALLSLLACAVAILAGTTLAVALHRMSSLQARRRADPFAQPRLSLRWLR